MQTADDGSADDGSIDAATTKDSVRALLDLDEDVLLHIIRRSQHSANAAGCCCTQLRALARNGSLWKLIVEDTWPHLQQEDLGRPYLTNSCLHFSMYVFRTQLCSRDWAKMDEISHLLRKAAAGFPGDASQRDVCLDRLAVCVLALFCSSEKVSWDDRYYTLWKLRLQPLVLMGRAASELRGWTSGIVDSLDVVYDPNVPRASLPATLLRCLRCASALAILRAEIMEEDVAHLDAERVGEAIRSLEMEGFDVSVAPETRPARLPTNGSHYWWYAQTRQGYLGGVNIR